MSNLKNKFKVIDGGKKEKTQSEEIMKLVSAVVLIGVVISLAAMLVSAFLRGVR